MAVEAGWPGLLIDEEHGGAGLGAFDALLVAEECGRVLAARAAAGAAAGDRDPQRGRRRVAAGDAPPASCGRRTCRRGRPAISSRLDGRSALRGEPGAGAPGDGQRRRGGARRRRSRSSPTRPAPTCWSRSASTRRPARRRRRSPPMPTASSVETVIRYDATRSLGHVTFSRRPRAPARRRRGGARRRLVPRPGADRGRVARRGSDVPGRQRRLRQGAVHVRPRDRLLPGDQARADRGPAPARERPRPPVLRRLGARVQARGVPARRERRAIGRRRRARLRGARR